MPSDLANSLSNFLCSGAEEDFAPLFEELYPRIRRFFCTYPSVAEISDELSQDTLLVVFQRAKSVCRNESFLAWTFKVARNIMLQHVRKAHPETQLGSCHLSTLGSCPSFEGSRLEDLISPLDPVSRDIVVLRFVEEFSYAEIAEALDLPIGTVKWKLFDAKARLAHTLARKEFA